MILMMVPLMRFAGWLRGYSKGFLPVIFGAGWQLLDAGQKGSHLPHILLTQSLAPGGHPGVADSGANGVEDVPLGIIQRLKNQLRRRRIETVLQRAAFFVKRSVTQGAAHGVDLHAIDQVYVGSGHGVIYARRMPLHGGIHCTTGEPSLELARRRG